MSSISPEEMRAIDENAEFLGVSRLQLMESAGKGVADAIRQRIDVKKKRVVILCSSGNKGGDGFVIARHLASCGADPEVYLLSKPDLLSSFESKLNFEAITKMSSTVKIVLVNNSSDL
ncbi:MAG: NAD(P)H-hydrate epimerase, partial [Candidatus Methanomethylicia archaeon]|nr:NAD(P)H-hydrate epimerase [Candidatus Methanomethylicia archaeon]